jgi:FkbM family methyltransferase
MYDELLRNAALNGTSNLVAERLAVSDSTGTGKLYLQGVRSSLICPTKGSTDESEEIGVISIDDYVGRTGTNVVSLLVLDVEGAELAALKGAENLLSHVESPDVIFEIIPQGGSIESEPADYLQTLGYTVLFIDDDYELDLRLSGKTTVTLWPIRLAPTSGRYFNALATRRPERLAALNVVTNPGTDS